MAQEKLIGKISHFYGNLNVGIIELSGELKVGDKIRVKGASSDFEQFVDSMQIDHENVEVAMKGDAIGLKVADKVRVGDEVYKISD